MYNVFLGHRKGKQQSAEKFRHADALKDYLTHTLVVWQSNDKAQIIQLALLFLQNNELCANLKTSVGTTENIPTKGIDAETTKTILHAYLRSISVSELCITDTGQHPILTIEIVR